MIPERLKRVEREIQRTLADILRDLKDPRLAELTVTGVTVAKDLRVGRVYVSTLRGEDREGILEALQKAAGYIGHLLGDELNLRRIPRFTFEYDPSLAQGAHIDALLAQVLPDSGPTSQDESETDDSDPSDL